MGKRTGWISIYRRSHHAANTPCMERIDRQQRPDIIMEEEDIFFFLSFTMYSIMIELRQFQNASSTKNDLFFILVCPSSFCSHVPRLRLHNWRCINGEHFIKNDLLFIAAEINKRLHLGPAGLASLLSTWPGPTSFFLQKSLFFDWSPSKQAKTIWEDPSSIQRHHSILCKRRWERQAGKINLDSVRCTEDQENRWLLLADWQVLFKRAIVFR